MTRKDYMDGKVTHREFYASVAKAAGIRYSGDHWLVERARQSRDPKNYNDISLSTWDAQAAAQKPAVTRALKEHEDFWSMAGGVCVAKEAVRQAVERQEAE